VVTTNVIEDSPYFLCGMHNPLNRSDGGVELYELGKLWGNFIVGIYGYLSPLWSGYNCIWQKVLGEI
tara:strand:+ start:2644 stop:2844 length:201 start_codon:yes stop_codon:yes gene_type:complete